MSPSLPPLGAPVETVLVPYPFQPEDGVIDTDVGFCVIEIPFVAVNVVLAIEVTRPKASTFKYGTTYPPGVTPLLERDTVGVTLGPETVTPEPDATD